MTEEERNNEFESFHDWITSDYGLCMWLTQVAAVFVPPFVLWLILR